MQGVGQGGVASRWEGPGLVALVILQQAVQLFELCDDVVLYVWDRNLQTHTGAVKGASSI